MKTSAVEIAVIPIIILFTSVLLFVAQGSSPAAEPGTVIEEISTQRDMPDFAAIADVSKKKETFFSYLLPMIRQANAKIRRDRIRLTGLIQQEDLSRADAAWMSALAERYGVRESPTSGAGQEKLLKRVDVIPASLVLAQAANESGWGTARFARDGNNFFGLWCWTESCGEIPNRRDEGKRHRVTSFDSVEDSVAFYLLTLNSHPAYGLLRDIRHQQRQAGTPLTGYNLAAGLLNYSERRDAYVREIREMIEYNNLQRFTRLSFDR